MSEGDQVTRGERGRKGDPGQSGDIGLTGETGATGETGETGARGREGKSTLLARHITGSFLLLALVSFVVLAVMGYAIKQNRGLIHRVDRQQQQLERQQGQQAHLRRENVRGLKILLVNQCRDIEKLKASIVAAAKEAGLPSRPARRFRPKPGGCGEYPPPIRP